MSPELAKLLEGPIIITRPLNDEQQAEMSRYVRGRDWVVNESVPFELNDDRVAGFISEDV